MNREENDLTDFDPLTMFCRPGRRSMNNIGHSFCAKGAPQAQILPKEARC